jgi:hypothetical protein
MWQASPRNTDRNPLCDLLNFQIAHKNRRPPRHTRTWHMPYRSWRHVYMLQFCEQGLRVRRNELKSTPFSGRGKIVNFVDGP